MDKAAFQLHKVRRMIKTQGQKLVFTRMAEDEYHEPNAEDVSYIEITGVYHETYVGHLTKTTADSTVLRQKVSPMFLCLWEEAQHLLHTDQTTINEKTYRINQIHNIAEAGIVADISLEELQDG